MKAVTIAGLFGAALIAVLVGPALPAPHPSAVAGPSPLPSPQPNCMLQSMGVDHEKLGSLLNIVLNLVVQLLYNGNDECQRQDLMKQMKCTRDQMQEFMDSQSGHGKGLLEGLLGPVLELVDELLEALLGSGGLLEGVLSLVKQLLEAVLCLLTGLGLDVDVQVMVKLGNILSIDFGVILNSPVETTPVPEPEPEADPTPEAEPGRSLGIGYESPYAQGCPEKSGGGGGGGQGGGGGGGGGQGGGGGGGGGQGGGGGGGGGQGGGGKGSLINVDLGVFVGVNLGGIGDLLNNLLGLLLGVAQAKPCEYGDHAKKFQGLLADLHLQISLLGINVQVNLLILLGPLIEAVLQLVEGLLNGILIDLSNILELVLNLLVTLGLNVDLGVAVKLANLLNLDVSAMINIG